MIRNASSQPKLAAMKGILTGAAKAPTVAPALKMLVAKARSFFGKNSAVALIAAGKFPASPTAKTKRAMIKKVTLMDAIFATKSAPSAIRSASALSNPTTHSVPMPQRACRQAPKDQTPMDHKYPFLVSIQSTNFPAKSMASA